MFSLFFIVANVYSQRRENIWCFGDSTLVDFNSGHFLPMPDRLVIALPPLHLERDLFRSAQVLHYIGDDGRFVNGRRAHREFALVGDEQHAIQGDGLARFSVQSLDFQRLTGSHTILFSTCLNYCVHSFSLKGDEIAPKSEAGVNPSFFCFPV